MKSPGLVIIYDITETYKMEESKDIPPATSPTPPLVPQIPKASISPQKEEHKPGKNEDPQQSRSTSEGMNVSEIQRPLEST